MQNNPCVMSREIFDALPCVADHARSDTHAKTLIEGRWHFVDQRSARPIEIMVWVSEPISPMDDC